MTDSTESTARSFTAIDLLRALPAFLADTPRVLRGALGAITLRPDSRKSIGLVLQQLASTQPERPFLRFEGGTWTYGQANAQVNRYAAVLAAHGVRKGDVVGVLATNRPQTLLVTLAAVKLGAIAGMLNHHQRSEVLDHSLRLLEATVLVAGAECREALESRRPGDPPETVLGLPADGARLPGVPDLDELAEHASAIDPEQCADVEAGSKAFYIFTSGTTGLPKASSMSHLRWLKAMHWLGGIGLRLDRDDTLYCPLPLYHNNALTISLAPVLAAGGTLALGRSFSASRFWEEVVREDATAFCYIGEMCRYLLNQPASDADHRHRVRVAIGNGLRPEIWGAFKERFGIGRIAEFYGASEGNIVFINALNLDRTAGTCPLPYAVVANDPETGTPLRGPAGRLSRVRDGEAGLLLTKITTRFPFDGYSDPKAGARKVVTDAFRTGDAWFNTGDLVRKQGFGHITFLDRLGDTFRWKGENVATAEVEGVLGDHPDIDQAVVYGVTVPGTDGRAGMAALRLRRGAAFDGAALARHLADRLPGYAAPLFVRLVAEIEQTSTFKVRKTRLREEGYDTGRVSDPVYVLSGSGDGYVPAYDGYATEVAEGGIRR